MFVSNTSCFNSATPFAICTYEPSWNEIGIFLFNLHKQRSRVRLSRFIPLSAPRGRKICRVEADPCLFISVALSFSVNYLLEL
jgi:hypothetical protein